jgi:Spy/CpxP family protein refolding chaperone
MRIRNRLLVLLVPCSILVAAAGLVEARPGPGDRGPFGRGDGRLLAEALDLTEDQREEMRGIRERYRNGDLGAYERDAHKARHEARTVVTDASASEDDVVAAVRRAAALSERAAIERHRMHVELDRVLTEEQRGELERLRAEREAEGPRFRHRRR